MIIEEKANRQNMEARIQANLDLINLSLSKHNVSLSQFDENQWKDKFEFPLKDWTKVTELENFLRNNHDFKQQLVSN